MTCPCDKGNICFLGAMHHGKTTFMDLLVLNTHEKDWKVGKEIRLPTAAE